MKLLIIPFLIIFLTCIVSCNISSEETDPFYNCSYSIDCPGCSSICHINHCENINYCSENQICHKRVCVECVNDSHCGDNKVCYEKHCIHCNTSEDCRTNDNCNVICKEVLHENGQLVKQCVNENNIINCSVDELYCIKDIGECVECMVDYDCLSNYLDKICHNNKCIVINPNIPDLSDTSNASVILLLQVINFLIPICIIITYCICRRRKWKCI